MPKTKISEFSTNPNDNTDINSINIAEGCSPANLNNAIREMMSDLKEWQSGAMDSYYAPAGTAAAPSYSFNGDTNSGFYSYGTDQVGVAVNGTSAGYFASTGWVGNVVGNVNGNLTATSPTAATQSAGTNNTTVATTAFVQAALQALYPVGSLYFNATNSTNPGTLLGFGTWSAFGAGRVPVGFDSTNALFDTAEETGGSADAITVSHTHSFSATTGTESANHNHAITITDPGHLHTYTWKTTIGGDNSGGDVNQINNGTFDTSTSTTGITASSGNQSANHTHSVSGTTGSTGSSGTNANYQPYITVYMWKRTA